MAPLLLIKNYFKGTFFACFIIVLLSEPGDAANQGKNFAAILQSKIHPHRLDSSLIVESKSCKPQGFGIEILYPQGKVLDSARNLWVELRLAPPGMDAGMSYVIDLPPNIRVVEGDISRQGSVRAGEYLSEKIRLHFDQWPVDGVVSIKASAILDLDDGLETVRSERKIIFGRPSFDIDTMLVEDGQGNLKRVAIAPSRPE
jgi:hypothetical protein